MASTAARSVSTDDQGVFVILFLGHVEEFARVAQGLADAFQRVHDGFEGFLFLAQRLGALGIVPDAGVFHDLIQFGEFFRFAVEVKDTSGVDRRVLRGRRCGWRRR